MGIIDTFSPRRRRLAMTLGAAICASVAFGSDGSLTLMPTIPNYQPSFLTNTNMVISGDGKTIAGTSGRDLYRGTGFKWTAGSAPILLGTDGTANAYSEPVGISNDGSTVMGSQFAPTIAAASTWSGSTITVLSNPAFFTQPVVFGAGITPDGKTLFANAFGAAFSIKNGVWTVVSLPSGVSGLSFQSFSPNCHYAICGATVNGGGRTVIYDVVNKTITDLGASGAITWSAVSNNAVATGYDGGNIPLPHSYIYQGGLTTQLPVPATGSTSMSATAISPDGTTIVGYSQTGGFIWNAQTGTQNLQTALYGQGAPVLPLFPTGFSNYYFWPRAITVIGGVAKIAGDVQINNPIGYTAFVATLRLPNTGTPIDLSGKYLAVKNSTVLATTDPKGVVGQAPNAGTVLDPGVGYHAAPFSNQFLPPATLSGLDLTGHSYWFDVELGDASTWPDLSSVQNYFIGQASIGQVGTELQVRASASTPHGIDVSSYNGLTISFYRKDGRFWGHVKNLWYDQDIDIPHPADVSKYHVNVSVSTTGAVGITITQSDGVATQNGTYPSVLTQLSGGSTDQVGLTGASFAAALVNVTDPTQVAASPVGVKIGGFATNAIPDALYVWSDNPYVGAVPGFFCPQFRVNRASLSRTSAGYSLAMHSALPLAINPLNLNFGWYENPAIFDGLTKSFAQNVGNGLDHGQLIASLANITKKDLLLETIVTTPFTGNFTVGPFTMAALPNSMDDQPSTLFNSAGKKYPTTLIGSNGVMVDTGTPTLTNFGLSIGGQAVNTSAPGDKVTVSVNAADNGSGIACNPLLTVTGVDNLGQPVGTPFTVLMGSADPLTGRFVASYTAPVGALKVTVTVSVSDRTGKAAFPATTTYTQDVLMVTVKETGWTAAKGTSIQRVLRVVLGGAQGFTPIVINKVVTFNANGVGTLTITPADGLPSPATAGITTMYVKDPYHTLGKNTAVTLVGGGYTLGATQVTLQSGDANNDNVIDTYDLAVYATFVGNGMLVNPNTTTIRNFGLPLPIGAFDVDWNADGSLDDYSTLTGALNKVGDPDPALGALAAAKTSLTLAQTATVGLPAWIQAAADVNHNGVLTNGELMNWIKSITG